MGQRVSSMNKILGHPVPSSQAARRHRSPGPAPHLSGNLPEWRVWWPPSPSASVPHCSRIHSSPPSPLVQVLCIPQDTTLYHALCGSLVGLRVWWGVGLVRYSSLLGASGYSVVLWPSGGAAQAACTLSGGPPRGGQMICPLSPYSLPGCRPVPRQLRHAATVDWSIAPTLGPCQVLPLRDHGMEVNVAHLAAAHSTQGHPK